MSIVVATRPLADGYTDCRCCGSRLFYNRVRNGVKDDAERGVCAECHDRPEARRFLGPLPAASTTTHHDALLRTKPAGPPPPPPTRHVAAAAATTPPPAPRPFNAAERSLIRSVHSYMPAEQLLDVLNTRLVADVGVSAVPFTHEQLRAEVEKLIDSSAVDGEWASLRTMLAKARSSGLLATITLQSVDDFAIVFGLSSAQHMRLRDVIRNAQEAR
jgi:hypothetical protein